ncbi:MAG: cupin-like domain-containing protein [Candidatus Obscuribacterales bacterium]|nr:cupin-like domain-containing protein [Candidatus Obscuribacterales bacterium]
MNNATQQNTNRVNPQWDPALDKWLKENLEAKCDPNELTDILLKKGYARETIQIHMATACGWQQWAALNLLLQKDANDLINIMVSSGVKNTDAQHIVQQQQKILEDNAAHPFIQAALSLGRKLNKQEWVLKTVSEMNDLSESATEVPRRSNLSSDEFREQYYAANRPVVVTDGLKNWKAMELWTPDFLKERFGNLNVAIQKNRQSDKHYQRNDNILRTNISLAEYVDLVKSAGKTNDYYLTANDSAKSNRPLLEALQPDMQPTLPYLDGNAPNSTGFLWFGPAGTVTPLHHDLTNNFMVQVLGSKRVRLINAIQQPRLANNLHCYSDIDLDNIDYERFPELKHVKIIDVTLEAGEALFIPVGWWHHVTGLEVSITFTFTNFRYPNEFTQNYNTFNEI